MKFKFLIALSIVLFAMNQKAHAYLDPGSGSMIVQVIVASVAAIGCFLYKAKENIVFALKKIFNKTKEENSREKDEN